MDYLDFELEIDAKDSGYTVTVVRSPAGEVTGDFALPFSTLELENQLLNLQNALLQSGNVRRRVLTPEGARLQAFGSTLFEAICSDQVRSTYDQSRREATNQGKGLRVKLRIVPPELAALPWEFMYDTRGGEFVALSRNTPLVRYLPATTPVRPLEIESPLRILAMAANPADLEPLDMALEEQRLRRALGKLEEQGLVKLDWLEGQTWRDLQQALYHDQYHVFHFTGHGHFDEANDEGMVLFCDQAGNTRRFDATSLARLLADHNTLRLVVLNTCEGAKAGQTDVFSSTAATLVRRGIPAVAAMQYTITDGAAIQLAETFYQAIASGLPVDAAMSEARKSITFAMPGSLEWGTPVLFMRAMNGRIFDITAPAVADRRAVVAVPDDIDSALEQPAEADRDASVAVPPPTAAGPVTTRAVTGESKSRRSKWPILAGVGIALALLLGFMLWRTGYLGGGGPPEEVVPAIATNDDTVAPAVVALEETDTPAPEQPVIPTTPTIPPTPTQVPTYTPTPIPPSISSSSVPEELSGGGRFTLDGRGEPGAQVEVMVDGAVLGTVEIDRGGYWSYPVELREPGRHRIGVRALISDTLVLSTGDPVIVTVPSPTPTATATATSTLQPTATATATPRSTSTKTATAVATNTPTPEETPTATSTPRPTATFTPRPTSTYTNTPWSTSTATQLPLSIAPLQRSTLQAGDTLTLHGAAAPGSTVQILVDGVVFGVALARIGDQWNYSLKIDEVGEHLIQVRYAADEMAAGAEQTLRVSVLPIATPTPTPTITHTPTLTSQQQQQPGQVSLREAINIAVHEVENEKLLQGNIDRRTVVPDTRNGEDVWVVELNDFNDQTVTVVVSRATGEVVAIEE